MHDVVIIGAGIIGSAIALELERRGKSALLLEKAIPGAESSSAAAGMLAPQVESRVPDPGFELGLYSRGLYPAFIEALRAPAGLDVGYRVDGAIHPVTSDAELERLDAAIAWQRERGLRVELIDAARVRRHVPGIREDAAGALFFPDEGQVDPRILMRALALATRRSGVTAMTGKTVRRILGGAGGVEGVELEDRTVACGRVIVAAGAWSALIEGSTLPRGTVQPARGQMLALDAEAPPFLPYLWTGRGYIVPRRDGRVLIGATVELAGYEKAVTAGGLLGLLQIAVDAVPALANARVVETWCGLRPWTPDHLPILGATAMPGLYVATGHYRNGILQAPATARLIADLVCGTAPALDLAPFGPERLTSPQ